MAVPPFQEIFLPFLTYLADGQEHTKHDVSAHLAVKFNLTPEDIGELLASGKQTKFMNRIAWTRTYFGKALLLESTSKGHFKITRRGMELLATKPQVLNVKALKQYPEFQVFHQSSLSDNNQDVSANGETQAVSDETPEERLESSYQSLRKELAQTLLQQVLQGTPAFFEQLVVDVLVAMGYGGSRIDAGKAIGQSGDEGIDGVIKEDRLGLDIIYLQAKRWTDKPVRRPDVQAFVGSLVGKNATKGVMLTTSRFTDEAREYAKHIPQKVVLIDGEELANLMLEFDVGVTPTTTYTVKKLDIDYFE
jgi:restriction system protein